MAALNGHLMSSQSKYTATDSRLESEAVKFEINGTKVSATIPVVTALKNTETDRVMNKPLKFNLEVGFEISDEKTLVSASVFSDFQLGEFSDVRVNQEASSDHSSEKITVSDDDSDGSQP